VRIRQVKPEFFRDKDMSALTFRTRLTYIGLWCMADDAGWFGADYEEIARELYGFDGWRMRERWLLEDLVVLQAAAHIEVEPCGHGFIPNLVKHQRFAGQTKRVFTTLREHETRCLPQVPADPREPPRVTASGIGSRNGKERNGTVDAREAQENDGLRAKLGSFEDVMATKPVDVDGLPK
jgi:hypothetical protein